MVPVRVDVLTHCCLCAVQLLYGSTAIVGKLGLRAADPVTFTLWRFLLAAPICVVVSRRLVLPPRSCWFELWLGSLCLLGSNLGITVGIVWCGQVTASAWQPLQLFFTTLLSFLLGAETLSSRKFLGVLCGLFGAFVIVLCDPSVHLTGTQGLPLGASVWGHLALFSNVISSGFLFVIRRRLVGSGHMTPASLVTWLHIVTAQMLLLNASFFFVLASVTSKASGARELLTPPSDPIFWCALAFYIVAPTLLCQSGNAWAAKYADPTTMAMYSVLQPVASAALSSTLRCLMPSLRETLMAPAANVFGGLFVVCGLWLMLGGASVKST